MFTPHFHPPSAVPLKPFKKRVTEMAVGKFVVTGAGPAEGHPEIHSTAFDPHVVGMSCKGLGMHQYALGLHGYAPASSLMRRYAPEGSSMHWYAPNYPLKVKGLGMHQYALGLHGYAPTSP